MRCVLRVSGLAPMLWLYALFCTLGLTGCRFDASSLEGHLPDGDATVPVDAPQGLDAGADTGDRPGDATLDGFASDAALCGEFDRWCEGNALVVCEEGVPTPHVCEHGCNAMRAECNACDPGVTACVGDSVVECTAEGTVGASTVCPLGCDGTSPPRCWALDPSNGLAGRLEAGEGDVLLQAGGGHFVLANTDSGVMEDCVCDGSGCPRDCAALPLPAGAFAVVAQAGGPEIGVWSFRSLTVTQGTFVRFVGSRPAALTSRTMIEVDGVLGVMADHALPGPGGGSGGSAEAAGTGPAPGAGGRGGDGKDDSGGGGGGFGGAGGGGGNAGGTSGGGGGQPAGSETLVPLLGGSGGGGGGDNDGGQGGAGGGAIQLVAGVGIHLGGTGVIDAGGGGGRGGKVSQCGDNGAGGGGGSGGAVLLEAPGVLLDPGAVIAANGGGGGGGSAAEWHLFDASCDSGGDGQNAGATLSAAAGGSGGRDGGNGGAGAAGGTIGGASGAGDTNGGGGGGGAGRIRINTRRGSDPIGTGLTSPALGTGAATQGVVGRR